jgi:anti-sigma factor ChrR (cupin superfamily)
MQSSAFVGLLAGGWRDLAFEPFRKGIDIHWLIGPTPDGPSAAILRYEPGADAPRHLHPALETVIVLDGSQSDENGHYPAGSIVFNPAGTEHSIHSSEGCVVLIQWSLPIIFLGDQT